MRSCVGPLLTTKPLAPASSADSRVSGSGVACVHDHGGRAGARRDLPAAFDAVDRGHREVDDRDVGAPALGDLEQLAAVAGLPDDAEVLLGLEHGYQPLAKRFVVVADHAPGSSACPTWPPAAVDVCTRRVDAKGARIPAPGHVLGRFAARTATSANRLSQKRGARHRKVWRSRTARLPMLPHGTDRPGSPASAHPP